MNKELRLKLLSEQAMLELEVLGIEHHKISKWDVNYRAKDKFGQCCKKNGVYTINISEFILDEKVSDEKVKNTIIHELLHAVDGCMNHGKKWKMLADKVNKAYGYTISRTSSYESFGLEREEVVEDKYIIECPCCHNRWGYQRMAKTVKYPSSYRCGKCKENLVRIK